MAPLTNPTAPNKARLSSFSTSRPSTFRYKPEVAGFAEMSALDASADKEIQIAIAIGIRDGNRPRAGRAAWDCRCRFDVAEEQFMT